MRALHRIKKYANPNDVLRPDADLNCQHWLSNPLPLARPEGFASLQVPIALLCKLRSFYMLPVDRQSRLPSTFASQPDDAFPNAVSSTQSRCATGSHEMQHATNTCLGQLRVRAPIPAATANAAQAAATAALLGRPGDQRRAASRLPRVKVPGQSETVSAARAAATAALSGRPGDQAAQAAAVAALVGLPNVPHPVKRRNVVALGINTYNARISACVKAGQANQALKIFHEIRADGLVPNRITYNAVISACDRGTKEQTQYIPHLLSAMVSDGLLLPLLGYSPAMNILDFHDGHMLAAPGVQARSRGIDAALAKAIFAHHVALGRLSDNTLFITGPLGEVRLKETIAQCIRDLGWFAIDIRTTDGSDTSNMLGARPTMAPQAHTIGSDEVQRMVFR